MTKKPRKEQPVDEVTRSLFDFATEMGKKGFYNETTARLMKTALRNLISIMGEDEPKDPEALLVKLDDLGKRWAIKNHAKPTTLKTYKTRARNLLTDYQNYIADPGRFKPRSAKTAQKKSTQKKTTTDQTQKGRPAKSDDASSNVQVTELRNYPLEDGRRIEYRLPANGVRVTDVVKFACHLFTMATDFDPSAPDQVQMMSMIRTNR